MKRSKAARRNAVLNTVMVVAVVLIVAAGVLAVGSVKGWFERPQPEVIVQSTAQPVEQTDIVLPEETAAPTAAQVRTEGQIGLANITRMGVSYALEDGTRLRDGDIIETLNAASVDIVSGQNRLTLDENARVQIAIDEAGMLTVTLNGGGVFAVADEPLVMTIGEATVSTERGVFAASAPYGSANVYVLEGQTQVGTKTASAGQLASIVSGEVTLGELRVGGLNEFELSAAKKSNEGGRTLCFTNTELDALEQDRQAQRQQALEAQLLAEQSEAAVEQARQENEQKVREQAAEKGQSVTADGNLDYEDIVVEKKTCTIEIRCDTILDNMEKLEEGKNAYVPENGCILATSRVSFDEGETVYDVLRRACDLAGIALEASWTPMYNSYYIEGIGNLYELNCGEQSGWTYKVNGWFPTYGASNYKLSDGDSIVFLYTCNGYGADVGGGMG